MTAAKKFVTQEQHEALKSEVRSQGTAIERLSVRVEVISHDTTRLLRDTAEIREEMNELREEMNERFESVATRAELAATREEILKAVHDGHAALLSAIIQLGKR